MQKVLRVRLFKAGYFERRVCLKSTRLKQRENKVNLIQIFKKHIDIRPFLFK